MHPVAQHGASQGSPVLTARGAWGSPISPVGSPTPRGELSDCQLVLGLAWGGFWGLLDRRGPFPTPSPFLTWCHCFASPMPPSQPQPGCQGTGWPLCSGMGLGLAWAFPRWCWEGTSKVLALSKVPASLPRQNKRQTLKCPAVNWTFGFPTALSLPLPHPCFDAGEGEN